MARRPMCSVDFVEKRHTNVLVADLASLQLGHAWEGSDKETGYVQAMSQTILADHEVEDVAKVSM